MDEARAVLHPDGEVEVWLYAAPGTEQAVRRELVAQVRQALLEPQLKPCSRRRQAREAQLEQPYVGASCRAWSFVTPYFVRRLDYAVRSASEAVNTSDDLLLAILEALPIPGAAAA